MQPTFPRSAILDCNWCGNRTPHTCCFQHENSMLYEEMDDGKKFYEPYTWLCYTCGTCGGLSLIGDFFFEAGAEADALQRARLHPKGAALLPPDHTLSPSQPIPPKVYRLYNEVWPLRHRSPAAFIGQARRLLEFVCADKGATGKDLFAQLQDLSQKGVFPGYFTQITYLLRKVGNLGAHAAEEQLSVWDAELIDDFFRSVIDYVYIAPARIRRMEERLKTHESSSKKP